MTAEHLLLIGLAAVVGGLVNALAGGGTLITFPMLTSVGIPAVDANIINTVAMTPGYAGAALAQGRDLRGQEGRVRRLAPLAVAGGVAGGALLLATDQTLFARVVPWLILLAATLLAVQEPLRRRLARNGEARPVRAESRFVPVLAILPAAVYGGYFGAGVSVIFLAVLGIVLPDSLTRLNALKQILSFASNLAAAAFFLFSSPIPWVPTLTMAACSIAGGALGGRLAGRIEPATLRAVVVVLGISESLFYFTRGG